MIPAGGSEGGGGAGTGQTFRNSMHMPRIATWVVAKLWASTGIPMVPCPESRWALLRESPGAWLPVRSCLSSSSRFHGSSRLCHPLSSAGAPFPLSP